MASRQVRKKEKKQKRRLKISVIIGVVFIVISGGFGTWYLLNQSNGQMPTVQKPADVEVILTSTIKKTQAAVKAQKNTSDYEELTILTEDAIAQIFTYMSLTTETQYHGTQYVSESKRQDYLEFLKTTLYFYYGDLVELYGEMQLPKVSEIVVGDVYESEFTNEETLETQSAYQIKATWDYEANKSTEDEAQSWSNTGTFTWIYDETDKQWYLVDFSTEYDETLLLIQGIENVTDSTLENE
ncbi:MAG: hypothetical protein ACRC5Q_06190 [Culicoidibacterales bacterium]